MKYALTLNGNQIETIFDFGSEVLAKIADYETQGFAINQYFWGFVATKGTDTVKCYTCN